ncbi:MAG: hypothetical protein IPK85_13965 [Gemmatimonadetes bacterium]|nr:hypothetical protein [Gemmatimonadota bacterium]
MPIPRAFPGFPLVLASALLACGGGGPAPSNTPVPSVPTAVPGVLARFAGQSLMVLPVTLHPVADTMGWRTSAGGDAKLRTLTDSLLEHGFRERGLTTWIYAAQVARTARRNPTYLVDPSTLRPALAVRAAMRTPDRNLSEPLASQLRALAGTSGVRYTMLPTDLELRLDGTRLTVAVVDVRLAQVAWVGNVAAGPQASWNPGVLSDLINRAADLVVPR